MNKKWQSLNDTRKCQSQMQGIVLKGHPSPKEHRDLVSELDQREIVG